MAFTSAERAFIDLCQKNVFIPQDTLDEFERRLTAEGNEDTFRYVFEDFDLDTCPKCGAAGAYKLGFLGRLNHPGCGLWYMNTGRYAGHQFLSSVRTGMDIAAEDAADAERKGKKQGCIAGAAYFVFGTLFRLIWAAVLTLIQLVVWLIARTSESRGRAEKT